MHAYIAENALSFIEEELEIFMVKLKLIESSRDNGYKKIRRFSSLLNEINLENVTSEITEVTSDAFNSLNQTATNCE